MGAFTDLSDYVNRMTGGNSGAPENLFFNKHLSVNGGTLLSSPFVPFWTSCWQWDGIPNAGAAATTAAAPDKSTTGALQFTNSAGSLVKRLVQGCVANVDVGSHGALGVLLADRLLATGGLSGTVTTAQTVGGSLTRYTSGVGNQIWIEVQTAIGGTSRTVTASYTNENGTSGRTTIARRIGGNGHQENTKAMLLPLQAGDMGVQSVQNVTISATTGTAGDFAVVIYHPIAFMMGPIVGMGPFGSLGHHAEIVDDACLTFLVSDYSVHTGFTGLLSMVDV